MTTRSTTVDAPGQRVTRPRQFYRRHDDLVGVPVLTGPCDTLTVDAVLDVVRGMSAMLPEQGGSEARVSGARKILEWLGAHPGEGWQSRWVNSGADRGVDWLADLAAAEGGRVVKAGGTG